MAAPQGVALSSLEWQCSLRPSSLLSSPATRTAKSAWWRCAPASSTDPEENLVVLVAHRGSATFAEKGSLLAGDQLVPSTLAETLQLRCWLRGSGHQDTI